MSWQHVELNMIPGGELPVVHVSQFDTLRAFHFDLKVGEDDWTIPEGIHFELHCRKVDDNIVIIAPDSTDTSSVTFTTTEQLTACSGKNECELVAIDDEDDSLIIGSINFILDVESDPLAGGLTSETAIYNLRVQIEDIISSEGYLKSDDVAPVALTGSYNDLTDKPTIPDMSNYYTKSETYNKTQVDDALALKANTADLATVATTGDYDDLLNKPTIPAAQVNSDWNAVSGVAEILNKPTIPTKTSDLNNDSDFQNEAEVNNLIAAALLAVMPVDSATGNPCSFDTDLATSLVGLNAEIVASGGGGTPSTPIPIVGISSLDIVRCGKNLFDSTVISSSGITATKNADGSITLSGIATANAYVVTILDINVGAGTYTFSAGSSSNNVEVIYTQNGNYGGRINPTLTRTFAGDSVIGGYIRVPNGTDLSTPITLYPQMELGSTATAYAPYNGQTFTIDLDGTRYGGTYTADGKLVVTHANIASYNGESINEPWLSSIDTYVPNTTPTIGAQVVYPLTTPIEIDVAAISVNAVSGVNNISSNGNGDVTAQYKVSIQKYIDDHV